jgi:predicted regulator of Ras-like GTPase activity (Roadblock/LC7/MglB family)
LAEIGTYLEEIMINKVQNLLRAMSNELPGVLAAAVVTVDDGLSIAEVTKKEGVETAAASAYLASIVKSNGKAIGLLADDEVTDDILITTSQYHFIIRHMPDQPFFIFVMTSKDEWLGKARMLIKKFEVELTRFSDEIIDQFRQAGI